MANPKGLILLEFYSDRDIFIFDEATNSLDKNRASDTKKYTKSKSKNSKQKTNYNG